MMVEYVVPEELGSDPLVGSSVGASSVRASSVGASSVDASVSVAACTKAMEEQDH